MSSALLSTKPTPRSCRMALDEKAERLKSLDDLDVEKRKETNTWDIMFVMPQNQFDVFLSSDKVKPQEDDEELKHPDVIPMEIIKNQPEKDNVEEKEDMGLKDRDPSPATSMDSTQQDALECLSITDSGILMDKSKSTPSPLTSEKEWPQPASTPCHHAHGVTRIGYVSAGSSIETLSQREDDPGVKNKTEEKVTSPLLSRTMLNEYSRLDIEKV